jgi:argininosuccinate lyase
MDRDFAAELVFACAQLQTHLAAHAEDLIGFAGPSTASSAAGGVHHRLVADAAEEEPDALELVRGKAARVDGALAAAARAA